jgi:hypothetical protein
MNPNRPFFHMGKVAAVWFGGPGGGGPGGPPPLYRGSQSALQAELNKKDTVVVFRDSGMVDGYFQLNTTSLRQDSMSGHWVANLAADPSQTVVFLGDPSDPTRPFFHNGYLGTGRYNSGPGGGGGPPPLFRGAQTVIYGALSQNDTVAVYKDSATLEGRFQVEVTSLTQDSTGVWTANLVSSPNQRVAFVTDNDPNRLAYDGGNVVAIYFMPGGGGPTVYNGPQTPIEGALGQSNNRVAVMTGPGNPPVTATVSPTTLLNQGGSYVIQDSQDPMKVFIFLAKPNLPGELDIDPAGIPRVMPRMNIAGP